MTPRDPWIGEYDEPADSWWAQRDADERARAAWRATERARAGFSAYTIHHDPDKRFTFAPHQPATRLSLVRAFARAATLCRDVPEMSASLKRRLIREALDKPEGALLNRWRMLRTAWVKIGMPRDRTPWRLATLEEEPR